MDRFRLDRKVAVVTGGAGIIGSRVCEALVQAGAHVAIFEINAQAGNDLAKKLNSEAGGERAWSFECDISQPEDVSRSVGEVVSRLGGIHVLFNNAASKSSDLSAYFAPFEKYSLQEWRKIMSVNVDGMMLVAQAVGAQMVEQGLGGSIIQTASIYGVVAPDNRIYEGSHYLGRQISTPAVYAASKGAVLAMTRYLSTYWASQGIRVNSITPGGVESGQNEQFQKNYSNRVPLGRMAKADEMSGAVVFLASDASSYVTGQNLIIDGGLTVW